MKHTFEQRMTKAAADRVRLLLDQIEAELLAQARERGRAFAELPDDIKYRLRVLGVPFDVFELASVIVDAAEREAERTGEMSTMTHHAWLLAKEVLR